MQDISSKEVRIQLLVLGITALSAWSSFPGKTIKFCSMNSFTVAHARVWESFRRWRVKCVTSLDWYLIKWHSESIQTKQFQLRIWSTEKNMIHRKSDKVSSNYSQVGFWGNIGIHYLYLQVDIFVYWNIFCILSRPVLCFHVLTPSSNCFTSLARVLTPSFSFIGDLPINLDIGFPSFHRSYDPIPQRSDASSVASSFASIPSIYRVSSAWKGLGLFHDNFFKTDWWYLMVV